MNTKKRTLGAFLACIGLLWLSGCMMPPSNSREGRAIWAEREEGLRFRRGINTNIEQRNELNDRSLNGNPVQSAGHSFEETGYQAPFPMSRGGGAPFVRRKLRDGYDYAEAIAKSMRGERQNVINGTARQHWEAIRAYHPELSDMPFEDFPRYLTTLDVCAMPAEQVLTAQLRGSGMESLIRPTRGAERGLCDRNLGGIVILSADCGNPIISGNFQGRREVAINRQRGVGAQFSFIEINGGVAELMGSAFRDAPIGSQQGWRYNMATEWGSALIKAAGFVGGMAVAPGVRVSQNIATNVATSVASRVRVPPPVVGGPVTPDPAPPDNSGPQEPYPAPPDGNNGWPQNP